MTENLDDVLCFQGHKNGDFTDMAHTTQHIKDVLCEGTSYGIMSNAQKEALDMIAHKMARIVNGDPNHLDHWLDIEGYAHITRIRIPQ
jgi:hypothetical protein